MENIKKCNESTCSMLRNGNLTFSGEEKKPIARKNISISFHFLNRTFFEIRLEYNLFLF
ncbi:hypothetical protein NCCP28_14530 [Niallia sp. NCCP-28]|nr:hypothetical protein NCCP28_14530 [Niallia sp. NCCP-28]